MNILETIERLEELEKRHLLLGNFESEAVWQDATDDALPDLLAALKDALEMAKNCRNCDDLGVPTELIQAMARAILKKWCSEEKK